MSKLLDGDDDENSKTDDKKEAKKQKKEKLKNQPAEEIAEPTNKLQKLQTDQIAKKKENEPS